MSGVQTTIPFLNRKKSFYGSKDGTPSEKIISLTSTPTARYTPTVKKLIAISSSESDSDSDLENSALTKISSSPRYRRKRKSDDENSPSPPKQKNTIDVNRTPSTAFNMLHLQSPKTSSNKVTPKSLFTTGKYCEARKALHISNRASLPGRESEIEKLNDFIQEHFDNKSSGSMYISGPPGTGKTACVYEVIEKDKFKKAFKIVYLNCTSMKSATMFYKEIANKLELKIQKGGKTKLMIEKYLSSSHKMLLLILDEVDQLETKGQSVLYSIFEWPGIPQSKLVLIGIANALDLTDRILPRLQSKDELKPQLMHFTPYTKQQITKIITERLESANVAELFSPVAIQLLAGKVAAVSGDIRRALDISRRGIEIAEAQKKSQILKPTNDNEANTGSPTKQENIKDKTVDIKDVLSILNSVYGGLNNVDNDDNSFPLQQKILLCSLMLILNKGKNKDVTIGRLHEVYSKVCRKKKINPTDISEFANLCTLVETRGVLKVTTRKNMKQSKITLQWDQEELSSALQDKVLLSEIFNDVSCL